MNRFAVFVVCLCMAWTVGARAQQSAAVRGVVVDGGSGEPLVGASVVLIHLPDSARKGVVTGREGVFSLADVAAGRYVLSVSFIGYRPFSRPLVVADQPVNVGRVALAADEVMTSDIIVEGKLPPASQQGDTSEFNARAFKTNPDANAEDLVTKMPGVTVQDGKVQAQGEDVQQVLVDGKPFFGDDPTAALRNLPAEVIEKIQVFDQQSEQSQFTGFNDGNTRKTLNIITRPGMKNGQFGKLYGGYGDEERYKAGGNYNMFNGDTRLSILAQSNNINEQNFSAEDLLGVMSSSQGGGRRGGGGPGRGGPPRGSGGPPGGGMRGGPSFGGNENNFLVDQRAGNSTTHAFGLNYTDQWGTATEVSGSYFFNMSDNEANNDLYRRYILPSDSGQVYDENSLTTSRNMNHRLNFRLDHRIDSSSSLLFRPRLSLQQNDGSSLTNAETRLGALLLNATNNDYSSDLVGLNFSGDLLYRYKFATTGRTLSIGVEPTYTRSSGESFLTSETDYYGSDLFTDSLRQRSDLLKNGWALNTEIDYTEPLGENSQLELEYEASYSNNDSDRDTYNTGEPGGVDIPDTALSSTFASRYMTQSLGTGYRYQSGPFMMSVEAAYQFARLNSEQEFPSAFAIERTFNSVMPRAMLRLAFSQTSNLRLFYRTRTTPPTIEQLQSVVNNSNPLQLSTGNPDLNQEYQHMLFMRYSSVDAQNAGSLFAMIGGMYSTDYVGNSTLIAARDTVVDGITLAEGTQLTRPVNLDGRFNLRSFLMYGLPVELLKSNLNLNASLTYSRTPAIINGRTNYASSPAFGVGVVLSSNISEALDFTVSSQSNYTIVSNSLEGQQNTEYFNQNTRLRLNWTLWERLVLQSDMSHQHYSGLSADYNQDFLLWNMGLGVKLFGERQGELRLTVFDLLNQYNNIQRNVTETYIEDVQTDILQRYVMLTFTYNIRNFGGGQTK